MTDPTKLVEQYTAALDAFNQALTRANEKGISIDERMRRMKDTDPHWDLMQSIQKEIDKHPCIKL